MQSYATNATPKSREINFRLILFDQPTIIIIIIIIIHIRQFLCFVSAVICPEPEVHNLTTVVPKLSVYRYIDKYKYACIKGYKNVGEDPVMVCIENGTWVVAGGLPLPDCQCKYMQRWERYMNIDPPFLF